MNAPALTLAAVAALAAGAAAQPTDAATRLAWHRRHLEMRDATPFAGVRWRWIGPTS